MIFLFITVRTALSTLNSLYEVQYLSAFSFKLSALSFQLSAFNFQLYHTINNASP